MKFTEEIIIKYLDGQLSQPEATSFEEELKLDKSLADLYEQHMAVHKALSANSLSSPSYSFTERVMQSVVSINMSEAGFFNRTRIYVLMLVIIAVATTIYYLSAQFYPAVGGMLASEINLRDFTLDWQPAQQLLSSDLLFKIVFYVNGLVSLLLLDQAILKPYFVRRRQRYSM